MQEIKEIKVKDFGEIPVSPLTGKPLVLKKEIQKRHYNHFDYDIEAEYYLCEDSGEVYTTCWINMRNNQKLYRLEVQRHINSLVICNRVVYRLCGLTDESFDEYDYFYKLDKGGNCYNPNIKERIVHHSWLCGFTPLKGFIPDEHYDRMADIWNLNNFEKVKTTKAIDYKVKLFEPFQTEKEFIEFYSNINRKSFNIVLDIKDDKVVMCSDEFYGFSDNINSIDISKFPMIQSITKVENNEGLHICPHCGITHGLINDHLNHIEFLH